MFASQRLRVLIPNLRDVNVILVLWIAHGQCLSTSAIRRIATSYAFVSIIIEVIVDGIIVVVQPSLRAASVVRYLGLGQQFAGVVAVATT